MKKKEKEIRMLELPETENFYNILIPTTPERIAEDTKKEELEPKSPPLSESESSEYLSEINIPPAYLKKYITSRPDGEFLEQVRISAKTKYELEAVLLKIKCSIGKKVPLSIFVDNILREHLKRNEI